MKNIYIASIIVVIILLIVGGITFLVLYKKSNVTIENRATIESNIPTESNAPAMGNVPTAIDTTSILENINGYWSMTIPNTTINFVVKITKSNDNKKITRSMTSTPDDIVSIVNATNNTLNCNDGSTIKYNSNNDTLEITEGTKPSITFTKIKGTPLTANSNILKMNGSWKNYGNLTLEKTGTMQIVSFNIVNDKVVEIIKPDGTEYAMIINITNNSIQLNSYDKNTHQLYPVSYTLNDDNTLTMSISNTPFVKFTK